MIPGEKEILNMAIVNREFDASEQKEVIPIVTPGAVTLTGGTYVIALVPYACEVKKVVLNAYGLSNIPNFEVEAYNFVVGAGATINSAISTATSAGGFGLSGLVTLTLGTAGSTQVQLQAGSALVLTVTGANSAASSVIGEIVVQKLQDIATYFGV
jgi:hypothetical protein